MTEEQPKILRTRFRRNLFGLLVSVFVFAVGIIGAEWFLRWRYYSIARSDVLKPGLSQPDASLGWRLSPYWQGRHRHHDFETTYAINGNGFRGANVQAHQSPAKKVAVVGDSFAFGTGVKDEEVFAHLLDVREPAARRVYNFSVPGFSTDQELLLVERDVLPNKPDLLMLVVYVANDLFDNQLPVSLQVRRHKPYFVLANDRLILTNTPVPEGIAKNTGGPNLLDMVLGNRPEAAGFRQRLEGRSHLFRLLSETVLPAPADDASYAVRQDYALRLFWALVERMQRDCATNGTRFAVAVLAGRSYVESPASLSAQFQEFFRRRIVEGGKERRLPVIDLAGLLRERYQREKGGWYYPNEGHLNAAGHRVVAELLADALPPLLAEE